MSKPTKEFLDQAKVYGYIALFAEPTKDEIQDNIECFAQAYREGERLPFYTAVHTTMNAYARMLVEKDNTIRGLRVTNDLLVDSTPIAKIMGKEYRVLADAPNENLGRSRCYACEFDNGDGECALEIQMGDDADYWMELCANIKCIYEEK